MKVADVYYTGRSRHHTRRGPSDERYVFKRRTSGVEDLPAEVHNVEDAIYFAESDEFDVQWTAVGELAKRTEGPVEDAKAALSEMAYRQKQKVAKALGVKANKSEDELDEALAPEIERLEQQMENL